MNVENILYLALGIIIFAVKTYSNYRKQEEEKKKAEQRRRAEAGSSGSPETAPAKPVTAFEEMLNEWLDIPRTATVSKPSAEDLKPAQLPREGATNREPVYTHQPVETVQLQREPLRSGYQSELPEEVLKARSLRTLHRPVPKPEEAEGRPVSFDLREAMIQQAILNRPDY
jgi:hypothetical protein